MRYETLVLRCECGRPALKIDDMGFTTDHQMVLHWRCAACRRHVYVLKSLADCWRDCPKELPDAAPPQWNDDPACEPDREFLRTLGVRLPD